jgi:hypothetical protein
MDVGGLGWFIAQRVVEEHGGRIRSSPGKRTVPSPSNFQSKENDEPL